MIDATTDTTTTIRRRDYGYEIEGGLPNDPDLGIRQRATRIPGSLPKPELVAWQIRMGEESANRIMRSAGRRGTRVHDIIEKTLLGEILPPDEKDEINRMARNAVEWVAASGWVPIEVEMITWSSELPLAGTVDLLAYQPDDGRKAIIDWKTSKRLHASHAIQQVIYRHMMNRYLSHRRGNADDEHGAVGLATAFGPEDVDELWVVHVTPEAATPYRITDAMIPRLHRVALTGWDSLVWEEERKTMELWSKGQEWRPDEADDRLLRAAG